MAVMAVIENQCSQGEVAQEFGVTRTAVNQWVQRYRRGSEIALKACKQGRREHPYFLHGLISFGEEAQSSVEDGFA